MNVETDLHRRAVRVARGEYRGDDLMALFLAIREHAPTCRTVTEIANFHAHRERDVGLTCAHVTDLYWVTQRIMFITRKEQLNLAALPSWFPESLRASLRCAPTDVLRKGGLVRQRDTKTLGAFLDRLIPNTDGTWCAPLVISEKESALVNFLFGRVAYDAAFDDKKLVADFVHGITSQSWASIRSSDNLRRALAAFAASSMHQRVVKLPDGKTATLRASMHLSPPEGDVRFDDFGLWRGSLDISGDIPSTNPVKGGDMSVAFTVFHADVAAQDVLHGPINTFLIDMSGPIDFREGKLEGFPMVPLNLSQA